VSGGADVLSGAILTNREDLIARIKESIADLGLNVAPDDAYLVLRGLRTLPARMERHQASAIEVARWLDQRPEVQRVLYPALEGDPGHELWKRDFSGASGVFSFVLQASPVKQVNAFLDALNLFGLGFSYGGFESLAIYCDPQLKRTAARPRLGGPLIRLSIGLEDPADLIADLEQAFGALA
jgi:cystathionine beta-lyase